MHRMHHDAIHAICTSYAQNAYIIHTNMHSNIYTCMQFAHAVRGMHLCMCSMYCVCTFFQCICVWICMYLEYAHVWFVFCIYWPGQALMPSQRLQKTPRWGLVCTPWAPLTAPRGSCPTILFSHRRPNRWPRTRFWAPTRSMRHGVPKRAPCAACGPPTRTWRSVSPPRAPS
jgi:hypothetical protein